MTAEHFTATILVNKSPGDAFNAITDPRAWWGTEIEGRTDRLNEEWTYRYKDVHRNTQQTSELVPEKKVVWQVVDSSLNFLQDKSEWNGTSIVFNIAKKGDWTEICFTHVGLSPDVECFAACSSAWGGLISRSLRNLIETGQGSPDRLE
jgi:uncharacterized protein YndB with AHSA1/START domain